MNTETGNGTNRAQGFRQTLANAAANQVHEQKNRLAARAGTVVRAVRQTADQLREPSPAVAEYVNRAADRLDDWVIALRDREVTELLDDLRGFARERPAVVIGGGFLLGLLAARFLKSSGAVDSSADDAGYFNEYSSEGSLT
jgi:hypothetical protein